MIKRDEVASADSCLGRAAADEPVFVLRANDVNAPATVRRWCELYVLEKGGNVFTIPKAQRMKLAEALDLADAMEAWKLRQSTAT